MKCEHCGFASPPGLAFCGKCGRGLAVQTCPHCQFPNPQDFSFCGRCGTRLVSSGLTSEDLERLRRFLPATYIEALDFNATDLPPELITNTVTYLAKLFERLATHLPTYVVEHVQRTAQVGVAQGEFVEGTLLFSDVSGFTAMSEKLSRIGREGAEEITSLINRYFSAMLGILKAHSGQLIQFGGDALLVLFLEPLSLEKAVQAAWAMQRAMPEFEQITTSQGVFPLQMKVGLHRGRFFAAQLGSAKRMLYGLFGRDVNATALAEAAASAGQVVLDETSLTRLTLSGAATVASERVSGYHVITTLPASPLPVSTLAQGVAEPANDLEDVRVRLAQLEALTPHLPADLLTRLFSHRKEHDEEGEHRLVGILFANFRGLNQLTDQLGSEQAALTVATLNHYFSAMEAIIRQFGGVVNKIDLYDHGNKLLAFFGAPVAHEDDAERAVRAALAMQAAVAEVNQTLPTRALFPEVSITQRIGISYGYVFAGYVGNDWRREYTIMGDEVNLAARLMSVADTGEIIVSAGIQRRSGPFFEFAARGEVKLKGKERPVPIFATLAAKTESTARRGWSGVWSPVVGRTSEQELLLQAFRRLQEGRGQIVSLIGEAGLGKSRLADEVYNFLLDESAGWAGRWIEGRCLSYTETVSYWPFKEILQKLAGITPDAEATDAITRINDLLGATLPADLMTQTAPYLLNFLDLPLTDDQRERVRYLDAEALQRRTFVAISGLIEQLANATSMPLVMVLEDIHWIDQASQAVLEHLLPLTNRTPLMVLLLYRPERQKNCWQIREKIMRELAPYATEIALQPLPPADSQELLINLAQVAQWPETVQTYLLEHTEGNPLYMEELVRTLIETHVLTQGEAGEWQFAQLSNLVIPDSLQGMLMTRLDRLEEPPRHTAQIASVIGRLFPFRMLNAIQSDTDYNDATQLKSNLSQLEQHEIVYESRRQPEPVFAFKHGLMQEVYSASLLARASRVYHKRIAEYLETQTPEHEREASVVLIARHAAAAQDWSRALKYLLVAGRRAQKLFANHEALEHYTLAAQGAEHLTLEETVAQRLQIHLALGELLTTTGKYDPAREHLQQALQLALTQSDIPAQAQACRWLARSYELQGDYGNALEWIEKGLGFLAAREILETVSLLLLAGQVHSRKGNTSLSLETIKQALTLAKQLGEVGLIAQANLLLGHLTRLSGNHLESVAYSEQAFQLSQSAGDIFGQALAQNQIANVYFSIGEWTKAKKHYLAAHQIFTQTGNTYFCAVIDNNLGGIAVNQGQLTEAISFYQRSLHSFEQIAAQWTVGVLHMNLGMAFIRSQNLPVAKEHLDLSLTFFEQAQSRDFLPELHRHFAEAALLAHAWAEAETHCQQALSLAREMGMRSEEGCVLRVAGELALAQGQVAEAEDRLKDSLSILKEAGEDYECARTQVALARFYADHEALPQVRVLLNDCLPTLERLEASLDLAEAKDLEQRLMNLA